MGIRVQGSGKKERTPGSKVVLKQRYKFFRKREIGDIKTSALGRNLELFAAEGDPPVVLRIFVEVVAKLYFTHVPLAVRDIGPEP